MDFRTGVRFSSLPPRRGDPYGSPYFCTKIRLHFVGCRSFSVKSHVCCGYVFASAGMTPPLHYQLFTSAPYGAKYLFCPVFPRYGKPKGLPFFIAKLMF
jgi:hypothetical protein